MATLSPPTLARLIKEARITLNQRDPNNSFWADDELTMYINDAIRQYFVVLNDVAEGQFDVKVALDLVSGQEVVTLPTDLFEIRAVYHVTNGCNQILKYYNNVSGSYSTGDNSSSEVYTPYYFLRGNDLVLRPAPNFSQVGALSLEYTAMPDTLITGLDTLTSKISPVFKELVVKYCVYQAKIKESSVLGGNTYQAVETHLADLFKIFKETVGGRSKYPQFVVPFNP